ncbi:hypothetical protein ACET3Z_019065 [Daucus carota]
MMKVKSLKCMELVLCCCLILSCIVSTIGASSSPLKVGYYRKSCPRAESIVRHAVNKAASKDPGIAASLIRMHFHDCFVRVSCSDIIAFAARDSALRAGGINYAVPSGRRDGTESVFDEVTQNLPPPSLNAQQLVDNFAKKGLSLDEMVTLSGAHSIGVSHCSSFTDRLYKFNATHPQDPSLDPKYAASLKRRCPKSSAQDRTVNLDSLTPQRLDNQYYVGLKYNRGLLTSDQTLLTSPLTSKNAWNNANYGSNWSAKFAAAMVRMGSIDVLTGKQGEIRRICSVVN